MFSSVKMWWRARDFVTDWRLSVEIPTRWFERRADRFARNEGFSPLNEAFGDQVQSSKGLAWRMQK
jgi:hypothetical protein